MVIAAGLIAASCAGVGTTPSSTSDTPPTTDPRPSSTSTVMLQSTTTQPTTTTLVPLPHIDLGANSVWYGPNFGSVDFPELFSRPELWESARQHVDVFKFPSNAVSGFPFDIGGDNVLPTFVEVGAFAKLLEWDIAISVEAGAIKFFACEAESWAEYANLGIDNIQANGGRVNFLSMDEPLIGGQVVENGQTCGYTMEETAEVVATFIDLVTLAHPEVLVGDIEAYPHYSVAALEEWILALEKAGAKPDFLHLDVDLERVEVEGQDVTADLRRLRDFAEQRGIPFGVILTANWTFTDSDERYYQSTIQWTETVEAALGVPTHVILQSWWGPAPSGLHEVPVNLPEDDPAVYSHTRLILEVLGILGS